MGSLLPNVLTDDALLRRRFRFTISECTTRECCEPIPSITIFTDAVGTMVLREEGARSREKANVRACNLP